MLKLYRHLRSKLKNYNSVKDLNSPILCYHSVTKNLESTVMQGNIHNVTPDNFYTQLKQLKDRFDVISVDELLGRIDLNQETKGTCCITFDDGYKSVVEEAYPVLEQLKIKATLYVNGSLIEKNTFWRDKVRLIVNEKKVNDFIDFLQSLGEDVKGMNPDNFYKKTKDPTLFNSARIEKLIDKYISNEMANSGQQLNHLYIPNMEMISGLPYLDVGNHSYNHYVLSSLTEEEQLNELSKGKNLIDKNQSKAFSIPFGGTASFNRQTVEHCKKLGYKAMLMCIGGKKINFYEETENFNVEGIHILNRWMPEDNSGVFN